QVGHRPALCRGAVEVFLESYCRSIADFSRQPILQVARRQIHRERRVEAVQAALRPSESADACGLLRKLTEPDIHGRPRFRVRPDSWRVIGSQARRVIDSLEDYRKTLAPERLHLFDLFRSVDVGFKVAGTGSAGLRDYVVLLEGNGSQDPL